MERYVLIYSNNSKACAALSPYVKLLPNIEYLCIDGEEARRKVVNSEYKISKVPCLLILSRDKVEKYEGAVCSEWFLSLASSLKTTQRVMKDVTPIESIITQQDDEGTTDLESDVTDVKGISSSNSRHYIEKGTGHENMSVSSLSFSGRDDDIPSSSKKEKKDVKSIVAEMAAEREGSDLPLPALHSRREGGKNVLDIEIPSIGGDDNREEKVTLLDDDEPKQQSVLTHRKRATNRKK